MSQIYLIAHNLRSTHNVGSLLRTAEGLGVSHVYLTGYTPHPVLPRDDRLPHLAAKQAKDIHKTALGAEVSQAWSYVADVFSVISKLTAEGVTLAAIEQSANSETLPAYNAPEKVALIVGREVEGIEEEVLSACDVILEIPMFGSKESFNVSVAAAMALYQCRFRA